MIAYWAYHQNGERQCWDSIDKSVNPKHEIEKMMNSKRTPGEKNAN
jgi:hypothetical protein